MIKKILPIMLFTPGIAMAVICKSIDDDGVVSYTDVPVGECKQQIDLPEYSRYAPRPIDVQATASDAAADSGGDGGQFKRYESVSIDQPKSGTTVRSNEGQVTVYVGLRPALQPGHVIKLTLDGRPVTGGFDGQAIDLSGVERGTHTLRASVSDADGRVLISTAPTTFTLRKRGITDSNAAAPGPAPPPPPPPGYPASDAPPDYSPGTANYRPTPPSSPGFGAGSSYAPKFSK